MPSRKTFLLSCVCAATFASSAAFAQTAAAPSSVSEIEELVVTAEKREQSLQDVPVAISAFTDERRELVGINSVQDLTNFTPGLAYSTNNDRISLRGIGRFTNNRSSEGGVAMYNDGFFTSSVTAFGQSTLFLERTEVLRGPQGTLYGKNAIGGALNIVSKRPTDDLYAEARLGYGSDDNKLAEAAVSGPLFGTVRGRAAVSWSNIGKGTYTNLNPNGKDEGNRGTFWSGEIQLDGSLADDKFEWWAKASTTEWHTLGRGPGGRTTAAYGIRDVTSTNIGALTPNSNFGASNQLPGNSCQLCFNTDDGNYINLESSTYTVNATAHFDGFDVKYITGMTYYDYRLNTDLDGNSRQAPFLLPLPARGPTTALIPGQIANVTLFPRQHNQYQEEVWWFSNELNFVSSGDGPVQWLYGLYQFREGSNYTLSDARYPDDARFVNPTTQTGAPAAPNPNRRYAYGNAENSNESYATFGQIDWQATETLKATVGLRYTYDRKRSFEGARLFCLYTANCPITTLTQRPVDITDTVSAPATLPQVDPSVVGLVYTDPTTGIRHRQLKNHWSAVTGTLGLDWKPDADTLVYAKYSRGYKAGGLNSGTVTLQQRVTTSEELINAYELGVKKTFGGRFQANASAFYYDYKDIQVPLTGLNPILLTNTTEFFNLPKAVNMGFEVETTWQPIDGLQILANYSYLNAKIKEACCFQDPDDPRGVQPGAQLSGNTAAQIAGTGALNQDLDGARLPSSTPHRFTINTNYTWEFEPGNVSASLTYVWRAATYYSVWNRYYNKAKSYGQTDARMLFNDSKGKFTAIAYMKNVFDQRGSAGISGGRNTTGPIGTIGFVNQTVSYVPPRSYGIELQLRY